MSPRGEYVLTEGKSQEIMSIPLNVKSTSQMIRQAEQTNRDPSLPENLTHKKDSKVPEADFKKIFIGNLPKNADEASLKSTLANYGRVGEVSIAYTHSGKACSGHGRASVDLYALR